MIGQAVRSGSLLVTIEVATLCEATARGSVWPSRVRYQQLLREVTTLQWLQWLGLPLDGEATVQVGARHTDLGMGHPMAYLRSGV